MKKMFSEEELSEIIEMALSDHISFEQIRQQYGVREKDVNKFFFRITNNSVIIMFNYSSGYTELF